MAILFQVQLINHWLQWISSFLQIFRNKNLYPQKTLSCRITLKLSEVKVMFGKRLKINFSTCTC